MHNNTRYHTGFVQQKPCESGWHALQVYCTFWTSVDSTHRTSLIILLFLVKKFLKRYNIIGIFGNTDKDLEESCINFGKQGRDCNSPIFLCKKIIVFDFCTTAEFQSHHLVISTGFVIGWLHLAWPKHITKVTIMKTSSLFRCILDLLRCMFLDLWHLECFSYWPIRFHFPSVIKTTVRTVNFYWSTKEHLSKKHTSMKKAESCTFGKKMVFWHILQFDEIRSKFSFA